MSQCVWTSLIEGSRCVRCGYPLPRTFKRPPVITCQPRESRIVDIASPPINCIHLGESISSVKVKCGPNRSSQYPVYECQAHNRCVPTYPGPWDVDHQTEAKLYHLCGVRNCPDYKPYQRNNHDD